MACHQYGGKLKKAEYIMSDNILTKLEDGIFYITINRLDKKNAITNEMYVALISAVNEYEKNDDARVLLLSGDKMCFTAGNDMQGFLENPPVDDDSESPLFLKTISQAKKPLLAAVNGPVVGIGTTMLMHFDFVYAGKSAKFSMPFCNLGICPEGGTTLLLPQVIGHKKACELIMFGESFDAQVAKECGFINDYFDDDEYLDKLIAKAKKLASQPASSIRLTKHMLKKHHAADMVDALYYEGSEVRRSLKTPESREAMSAFTQKRRPDFSQFN